jgi:hypothetical protein
LNLSWEGVFGGPVDASFFATNVLDDSYRTEIHQNNMSYSQMGAPRMFGGRLKLRFGADART